jgi:hypothetical protein
MNQTEKNLQAIQPGYSGRATVLPVCSFCSQVPAQGIRGGIKVGKAWLCQACEGKIIQTEVGSSDYEIMMEKIKNVWR